jgi:hypothetical protein
VPRADARRESIRQVRGPRGIRTMAETATSLTSHRNAGLEQPSGAPPGSIRLRPGSGRRPWVMRRAGRGCSRR